MNEDENPEETKMSRFIRVQIPGAPEFIAVARSAVDAVGEQMRLSPGDRAAIKLAVGEACENAVRYGRPGEGRENTVVVACRAEPDALEIEVVNRGNGFHPLARAEMPEALAERGRGRALMEILMDSVEYLSENGDTVVRMRKSRSVPGTQRGGRLSPRRMARWRDEE